MSTLLASIPDDMSFDWTSESGIVFSADNSNAITVSSDGDDEFYVAVWVVNGNLALGSTSGITLVKTYDDSENNFYGVLVKGTADAINAALDGLTYTTFGDDTGEGDIGYPYPWTPRGDDDMLMVYLSETEPSDDDVMMNMDYMLNIDIFEGDSPTVVINEAETNATLTDVTTASFSWVATDHSGLGIDHYEYSTDGGTTWTSTTDTSVTLSGLTAGVKTFQVRAIDSGSNVGVAASDSWTVQTATTMKATSGADIIVGGSGSDTIVPMHAVDIAGDTYDGGDGHDVLKITTSMMNIDLPANGFDFTDATVLSIEELDFNYMPMPMPGQVIFSSDQFGDGLISNDLVVKGSWGSNDIVVNLTKGNSDFSAAGWTFPVSYMGLADGETATTEIVDGVATGNASSMWGHYIYQGSRTAYVGHDVGAGTEETLNGWDHGVVYENGVAGDTITLKGSSGNNVITGSIVDDLVYGNAGRDVLKGGTGDDIVKGGADADRLVGGADDDSLYGGRGTDVLTGGDGADMFCFSARNEAYDRIIDFEDADLIVFDGAAFGGLTAGALSAENFAIRSGGHSARDANDFFIYDKANDTLWYDADGSRRHEDAVKIASLNDYDLHASDILIA